MASHGIGVSDGAHSADQMLLELFQRVRARFFAWMPAVDQLKTQTSRLAVLQGTDRGASIWLLNFRVPHSAASFSGTMIPRSQVRHTVEQSTPQVSPVAARPCAVDPPRSVVAPPVAAPTIAFDEWPPLPALPPSNPEACRARPISAGARDHDVHADSRLDERLAGSSSPLQCSSIAPGVVSAGEPVETDGHSSQSRILFGNLS